MFAISRQSQNLSPHCMRFADWWIYDLRSFHPFWKERVRSQSQIASDETIWAALLKAYGLHLFSNLDDSLPFASDYHSHFKTKISLHRIRENYFILKRLGLEKIGHLRRLPFDQIQKRFGLSWKAFLEGLISPHEAKWSWEPYRPLEPLDWTYEFENLCTEGLQILNEIDRGLSHLSEKHPHFGIQKINLELLLSEISENFEISFDFTYRPFLQRDLKWILKLFEERLLRLELPYPVWKVFIKIFPAPSPASNQLSLFENKAMALSLQELCQKLKDQKFTIFQPESSPSYLPENSWKKSFPGLLNLPEHGLLRPLIQIDPKKISMPEGHLQFTERLTWFDERGIFHSRDYFITRSLQKNWIWIFKNESNEWFQQGVVE